METRRPLFLHFGMDSESTSANAFAMADFAVYLSLQASKGGGTLSAQRVADLCAAVGKRHVTYFGFDPVRHKVSLHRSVVRSLKRAEVKAGKVARRKLPFTSGMLLRSRSLFNLQCLADLELWCALNLAVNFLLRISETLPTAADHWPRRKDLRLACVGGVHCLTMTVRSAKNSWAPCDRVASTTEPWREETIHHILQRYLDATPLDDPAGPLFPRLNYDRVLGVVKHLAECLGFDGADFGTHSFRRGGTYDLLQAGAEAELVKTQGRWLSDEWANWYGEIGFALVHRVYV
jgi:hypothetical protein